MHWFIALTIKHKDAARLIERNYVIVATDPLNRKGVGYDSLKLKAEIVTVSHGAVKGVFR